MNINPFLLISLIILPVLIGIIDVSLFLIIMYGYGTFVCADRFSLGFYRSSLTIQVIWIVYLTIIGTCIPL